MRRTGLLLLASIGFLVVGTLLPATAAQPDAAQPNAAAPDAAQDAAQPNAAQPDAAAPDAAAPDAAAPDAAQPDAAAPDAAAPDAAAPDAAPQEAASAAPIREYLLLATNKTSTLEEELNEAADAGYRFLDVMGGETAFGGDEAVAILERVDGGEPQRYEYKLLATNRTSTMQEEAQEAADAGYRYMGQTVFSSMFGGQEVVLILERDLESPPEPTEILLLATSRTSTMQEELSEAADAGYQFVGFTVGSTAFRGNEVVAIMWRAVER